jgi:hypothetical protein
LLGILQRGFKHQLEVGQGSFKDLCMGWGTVDSGQGGSFVFHSRTLRPRGKESPELPSELEEHQDQDTAPKGFRAKIS